MRSALGLRLGSRRREPTAVSGGAWLASPPLVASSLRDGASAASSSRTKRSKNRSFLKGTATRDSRWKKRLSTTPKCFFARSRSSIVTGCSSSVRSRGVIRRYKFDGRVVAERLGEDGHAARAKARATSG